MEYRFTYLFRFSGTKEALDYIETSFQNNYKVDRVPYTKKEVIVPEDNHEALDDEMECDLKLAQYNLDKDTEQAWGDIAGEL